MAREVHYDRHVGVDYDGFDCALTLTVWNDAVEDKKLVIRIPVENIPTFLNDVVSRGATALTRAASRIEVGHCETCANTGLVPVERHGRMSNDHCPDCKHRWPDKPFASAPTIGRRGTEGS